MNSGALMAFLAGMNRAKRQRTIGRLVCALMLARRFMVPPAR